MDFPRGEPLPISALQHLLFCERQCALIHIERQWLENRLTVEGAHLHERAHQEGVISRGRTRIAKNLQIHSERLGIWGRTDIVEFVASDDREMSLRREGEPSGLFWAGWLVTPVEYKRGKPKQDDSDRVQLCAQAMCLEEMLKVEISHGKLFYGKRRRRTEVEFDQRIRERTTTAVLRLHELLASGVTPQAVRERKCEACSLLPICMPPRASRSANRYFNRMVQAHLQSEVLSSDPWGEEDFSA